MCSSKSIHHVLPYSLVPILSLESTWGLNILLPEIALLSLMTRSFLCLYLFNEIFRIFLNVSGVEGRREAVLAQCALDSELSSAGIAKRGREGARITAWPKPVNPKGQTRPPNSPAV